MDEQHKPEEQVEAQAQPANDDAAAASGMIKRSATVYTTFGGPGVEDVLYCVGLSLGDAMCER